MYHTRYSYPFYIKDVRRVGQLQAAKVFSISSGLIGLFSKNTEKY